VREGKKEKERKREREGKERGKREGETIAEVKEEDRGEYNADKRASKESSIVVSGRKPTGSARLGLTVRARITKANYALGSKKGNHGKNRR